MLLCGIDVPTARHEVDITFSCQPQCTSIPSGLTPKNISEGEFPELGTSQILQVPKLSTPEESSEFGGLYQKLGNVVCVTSTPIVFEIINLLQVRILMLTSSVLCLPYPDSVCIRYPLSEMLITAKF